MSTVIPGHEFMAYLTILDFAFDFQMLKEIIKLVAQCEGRMFYDSPWREYQMWMKMVSDKRETPDFYSKQLAQDMKWNGDVESAKKFMQFESLDDPMAREQEKFIPNVPVFKMLPDANAWRDYYPHATFVEFAGRATFNYIGSSRHRDNAQRGGDNLVLFSEHVSERFFAYETILEDVRHGKFPGSAICIGCMSPFSKLQMYEEKKGFRTNTMLYLDWQQHTTAFNRMFCSICNPKCDASTIERVYADVTVFKRGKAVKKKITTWPRQEQDFLDYDKQFATAMAVFCDQKRVEHDNMRILAFAAQREEAAELKRRHAVIDLTEDEADDGPRLKKQKPDT